MDKAVTDFLNTHRVSVLGILQEDNSIHSATLHFAYAANPPFFFFLTEKTSRKCRPLLTGKEVTASLVIGFDESEFKTFQAKGSVMIVNDDPDLKNGWEIYGQKYHDRIAQKVNPDMVLLRFVPRWWHYQDLKASPLVEFSSERIVLPKVDGLIR